MLSDSVSDAMYFVMCNRAQMIKYNLDQTQTSYLTSYAVLKTSFLKVVISGSIHCDHAFAVANCLFHNARNSAARVFSDDR